MRIFLNFCEATISNIDNFIEFGVPCLIFFYHLFHRRRCRLFLIRLSISLFHFYFYTFLLTYAFVYLVAWLDILLGSRCLFISYIIFILGSRNLCYIICTFMAERPKRKHTVLALDGSSSSSSNSNGSDSNVYEAEQRAREIFGVSVVDVRIFHYELLCSREYIFYIIRFLSFSFLLLCVLLY